MIRLFFLLSILTISSGLFADPMFVDPAGGNFTFREGSPALELGIEALDVSKMGMLDP